MRVVSRNFVALGLLAAVVTVSGCGSSQPSSGAAAGSPAAGGAAGASAQGGAGAVSGAVTGGASGVSGSADGGSNTGADAGATSEPEPTPGPKRCTDETEAGATTASAGARVVKSGGASPGKTAQLVGFSATDVLAASNAALWARYSGAQTFRTFGSVPPKSTAFDDKVTSQALFSTARDSLSSAPDASTAVDWKYTSGAITDKVGGVLAMAAAVNVPMVVEIKTPISAVALDDSNTPAAWQNKWQVWKNYFASAYLYARDYGASRFKMYNEPDLKGSAQDPPADYTIRAELAGDAIQLGVKAANAARQAKDPTAKPLQAVVIAPTTATGAGHLTYGQLIVANLHMGPLGTPAGNDYTLFQGYSYHAYAGDGLDSLTKVQIVYNGVLKGKLENTPWYITEFNSYTNMASLTAYAGGSQDYVADEPDFSRRLTEKAIGYTEANVGPMNLYAFNYLSEADGASIANNGLYWSNNSIIGGDSLAAAAYRLMIKHFSGLQDRVGLVVSQDAGEEDPATLFEATYDAQDDAYYIAASNRSATTQKQVFFDLSSLALPAGNIATVIDVDAKHHGEVTHRIALSANSTFEISQEANAITLVSVPRSLGIVSGLGAVADTTLAPGTQSMSFGTQPTLALAADSTAASKLRAALVAFELPSFSGRSVGEALLDLSLTPDTVASNDVLHVYGIPDTGFTDDAATGVRWADVPNLRALSSTAKYATISDNAIQYLPNGKVDPNLRIAGTAIASGGLLRVNVTDYVREQAALRKPRVTLLLVREVNHHTETIGYSAAIRSRESDCGAPALYVRTFAP